MPRMLVSSRTVTAAGFRRTSASLLAVLTIAGPLAYALTRDGPARPAKRLISIMLDDDLVVSAPDGQRVQVLRTMKDLGVDVVRVGCPVERRRRCYAFSQP